MTEDMFRIKSLQVAGGRDVVSDIFKVESNICLCVRFYFVPGTKGTKTLT